MSIPNEGTSWIPGKSIRFADVKGAKWWHVVVALRVHRPSGQGHKWRLEIGGWKMEDSGMQTGSGGWWAGEHYLA